MAKILVTTIKKDSLNRESFFVFKAKVDGFIVLFCMESTKCFLKLTNSFNVVIVE